MEKETKLATGVLVAWVIGLLISLGLLGVLVYVVIHTS